MKIVGCGGETLGVTAEAVKISEDGKQPRRYKFMQNNQETKFLSAADPVVIDMRSAELDLMARTLGVKIRPKHRQIFLNRVYASTDDLKRALKRYKVFGDLGYGHELGSSDV